MAKHTTRTTVSIEPDALISDIRHILELTAQKAEELETFGKVIFDAIAETARNDPADELRDRAARLRGGARNAMALAAEIESAAGRLEGIAYARRIIEDAIDVEDSTSDHKRRR